MVLSFVLFVWPTLYCFFAPSSAKEALSGTSESRFQTSFIEGLSSDLLCQLVFELLAL